MSHLLKNNKLIRVQEDEFGEVTAEGRGKKFVLKREINTRNDRLEYIFVDEKRAQYKRGFFLTKGDAINDAIVDGYRIYNGDKIIVHEGEELI